MAKIADEHSNGKGSGPLPVGWDDQALADANQLAIFGSAAVALASSGAYFAALHWGTDASLNDGRVEELREKYFNAESKLLRLIRKELRVPGAESDLFPV